MTAAAGLAGSAPVVTIAPTERAKYEAMWSIDAYRHVAPGADAASRPRAGPAVRADGGAVAAASE